MRKARRTDNKTSSDYIKRTHKQRSTNKRELCFRRTVGGGTPKQPRILKMSNASSLSQLQDESREQLNAPVSSKTSFPGGCHAIATAYGDYAKKSFEETRSFVEKLSGVKSVGNAIELQTEFAKSSFETFMGESQKIGALYRDLATQSYKPFGDFLAKATPINR
jgi:hypothetical protein